MSNDNDTTQFERRTKQLFDDSVAALDAATHSRLTQARYRALEQRTPARGGWRWSLVPAGTLAGGAWAGEDDEWLAIEEWQKDNGAEPEEESEEDSKPPERQRDDDDESD